MTNERKLVRGKTGFDMVVRTPEERERVYNPSPSEVAVLLMLRASERTAPCDDAAAEPNGMKRDKRSRVHVNGKQMRRRTASS